MSQTIYLFVTSLVACPPRSSNPFNMLPHILFVNARAHLDHLLQLFALLAIIIIITVGFSKKQQHCRQL